MYSQDGQNAIADHDFVTCCILNFLGVFVVTYALMVCFKMFYEACDLDTDPKDCPKVPRSYGTGMNVIGCIAIIIAIVAALSMIRNYREASRERPTAYGELATDVDEENADDDDVERLERGAGS